MLSKECAAFNAEVRAGMKDTNAFMKDLVSMRATWVAFGESLPPLPAEVRVETVNASGVSAEWVTAPSARDNKVVLELHAGGYFTGSTLVSRQLNAAVSAASGARVFGVDYRHAPEAPFPAAVQDVVTAYRWLLDQGVLPGQVAWLGESAGGGLVFGALQAARDQGLPMPAAAVALSPWADLANDQPSRRFNAEADPMILPASLVAMAAMYLQQHDAKDPLASPVYGDLSGLPPSLILVGSTEVLLDDARALFWKLTDAGVETLIEVKSGMPHIWPLFPFALPEARTSIHKIGEFIREHLG